jgi:hypothetical protein
MHDSVKRLAGTKLRDEGFRDDSRRGGRRLQFRLDAHVDGHILLDAIVDANVAVEALAEEDVTGERREATQLKKRESEVRRGDQIERGWPISKAT